MNDCRGSVGGGEGWGATERCFDERKPIVKPAAPADYHPRPASFDVPSGVAQSAEQRTVNPLVVSSSLTPGATKPPGSRGFLCFLLRDAPSSEPNGGRIRSGNLPNLLVQAVGGSSPARTDPPLVNVSPDESAGRRHPGTFGSCGIRG